MTTWPAWEATSLCWCSPDLPPRTFPRRSARSRDVAVDAGIEHLRRTPAQHQRGRRLLSRKRHRCRKPAGRSGSPYVPGQAEPQEAPPAGHDLASLAARVEGATVIRAGLRTPSIAPSRRPGDGSPGTRPIPEPPAAAPRRSSQADSPPYPGRATPQSGRPGPSALHPGPFGAIGPFCLIRTRAPCPPHANPVF